MTTTDNFHCSTTDAFHEVQVLPEIDHWQYRLKKNMQRSDITSSEILDPIQERMLRRDHAERLTSNELCEELDSIIATAGLRLCSEEKDCKMEEWQRETRIPWL